MNQNVAMPELPGVNEMPSAPAVNEMPSAPAVNPQPQNNVSNNQNQGNTLNIVGRVSFPSTQLVEATGFVDVSRNFPSSNAFLMFVPNKPDNTKATGRTYVQDQKETMKIMIRDLYALAEALKFAALYKKNPGFMIFTDSSKFAGNQGQGTTKNVSVTVAPSKRDPNKFTIFLSFKGQQKITIAMEDWHAIGFANQLIHLANETEKTRFETEKTLMQGN